MLQTLGFVWTNQFVVVRLSLLLLMAASLARTQTTPRRPFPPIFGEIVLA